MRVARVLWVVMLVGAFAIGCAQGRSMTDAGAGTLDARGEDAATFFPDAFTEDAPLGDAPGLDAFAIDAPHADARSADAFAPGTDAFSRDAFVPGTDAFSRDAGRDAWAPDAYRCPCGPGACTTSCGTTGSRVCTDPCAPICAPPGESCNATDDDCDGSCDEDLGGCRVGVARAYHDSLGGHFYTTDASEAIGGGYRVEIDPFFFVYPSPQPGLVPFHRCYLNSAHRLYTTDAGCEGSGAIYEGILGYVATSPVCGARPLYRMSAPFDHFYTTDAGERDAAVAGGYFDEGAPVYVW